jgi:hypothetical protein
MASIELLSDRHCNNLLHSLSKQPALDAHAPKVRHGGVRPQAARRRCARVRGVSFGAGCLSAAEAAGLREVHPGGRLFAGEARNGK